MGTGFSLLKVKAAGAWSWPLMPSSADKDRVKLLLSFWPFTICLRANFTFLRFVVYSKSLKVTDLLFNPYPTAFPYGNGMVLHFYQQKESSTTKTVHTVINKGLKAYV